MTKNAVTFAQLSARLDRAIHAETGLRGLNILLYGWIAKHGRCSRPQFAMRKKKDGVYWLTGAEAEHFSRYCGYDLTHD